MGHMEEGRHVGSYVGYRGRWMGMDGDGVGVDGGVLGAIIGLVVWAVSRLTGENRSTNVSALDIARARYARGEIGKEEFEELRQALQ